MENKIGPPVSGDDFFDRKSELGSIKHQIAANPILLLAPRRVGKTSIMFQLRDTANEQGFSAVYASVAGETSEDAFINCIWNALAEKDFRLKQTKRIAKSPIGNIIKRIRKVGTKDVSVEIGPGQKPPWRENGDRLSGFLSRKRHRWMIMLDEVPVFVLSLIKQDPSGERPHQFLNWFRRLRQSHQNVSWLLAGSIGLDTVVQQLNLADTINDLFRMSLGPFAPDAADGFLEKLAHSYSMELTPSVRKHILDCIEWPIPYFLQLIFSKIREISTGNNGLLVTRPQKDHVDQAFEMLLKPAMKGYFDYWRQRLHDELGSPEDKMAFDLLSASAVEAKGANHQTLKQILGKHISDLDERNDMLRYLLDILENDGYLVSDKGRYAFRSPLLRQYWLRRVLS